MLGVDMIHHIDMINLRSYQVIEIIGFSSLKQNIYQVRYYIIYNNISA